MILLLVLATVVQGSAADTIKTGAQFLQIVEARHSDIKDIRFIYEGDAKYVGPKKLSPGDPSTIDFTYQGEYRYRADGTVFMDIYSKGLNIDSPFVHSQHSFSKGTITEFWVKPDTSNKPPSPTSGPGAPGGLNIPSSAQRIVFFWLLRSFQETPDLITVSGTEIIDGQACVVLEVDLTPGNIERKGRMKMWVDVERGCNPLKLEEYEGGDLVSHRKDVKLLRHVTADSKQVWIPVHGVFESFRWYDTYYKTPIIRETFDIVDGTLVINGGIAESEFAVPSRSRQNNDPLRSLSNEFIQVAKRPRPPAKRADPLAVQSQLESQLALAKTQGKLLEASNTDDSLLNGYLVLPTALLVSGFAVMVIAVALRRKHQ